MKALGLTSKTALANKIGISLQNLRNRENIGVNKLDDVELLCNREKIDREYIFTGKEPVLGQVAAGNGFLQSHSINGHNVHIDIHTETDDGQVRSENERYSDPVFDLFVKDWRELSDIGKLRAWTLIKEILEKEKAG